MNVHGALHAIRELHRPFEVQRVTGSGGTWVMCGVCTGEMHPCRTVQLVDEVES